MSRNAKRVESRKMTKAVVLLTELAILLFCQACNKERERRANESLQRSAMETYANGLKRNYMARKEKQENELEKLRGDAAKLSSVLASVKTDATGGEKREARLLNILEDRDINYIALKHLGSDFNALRIDFSTRLQEIAAEETKYATAVKEVEDTFAANSKRASTLTEKTTAQREVEMKRLRGELQALERKRASLHEEYRNFSSRYGYHQRRASDRKRNDAAKTSEEKVLSGKLYDMDLQITKKRAQIDSLTSPEAVSRLEKSMLSEAQSLQAEAFNTRESTLREIDRRLKPKKTSAELVSEIEAKSVIKLRDMIAGKVVEGEKKLAALTEKISAIEDFLLAIPVSDIQSLERSKERLSN